MNTILEQYKDKINGTFSFFDRIIIKGHIRQFFSSSGKKHFLSYNGILLKEFSAYAQSVTEKLCAHIDKLASDLNRPIIYLPSAKTPKEQTAKEFLSGAACTPAEIYQMVDEMLIAGEAWLPQYQKEIEAAKIRFSANNLIPPKEYKGIRVPEKSVEEMRDNKEAARKNAAETDKAKDRPSAK